MPAKRKVGTLVTEGNLSPEKRFRNAASLSDHLAGEIGAETMMGQLWVDHS